MTDYPKTLANGKTIVDERCTCGALMSAHDALEAGGFTLPGKGGREGCERFTWAGFVYADGTED